MYEKSKIRYACYRAKNDCVLDKHKEILNYVEKFLGPEHKWERFSVTWDVLVDEQTGEIEIIKPEDDFNYINNTCLEAKILAKKGIPFDDFDKRQNNLLKIVESHMLNGLMRWENYGEIWEVTVDSASKQITTKMRNVTPNQIEVTEEMIERSKRDPSEIPEREEVEVETEVRDATPEEIERIREKMGKMGIDTPDPEKKKAKKKVSKKKKKTVKKKTSAKKD